MRHVRQLAMDTPHRRLFRRSFIVLEVGGTAGMKPSVSSINDAELSEIIMEINDLRKLALDPDRPEQNRWRC
jgi:hypothetical protein